MRLTGYENIFLRGMMMGLTRREGLQTGNRMRFANFSELGEYLDLPIPNLFGRHGPFV